MALNCILFTMRDTCRRSLLNVNALNTIINQMSFKCDSHYASCCRERYSRESEQLISEEASNNVFSTAVSCLVPNVSQSLPACSPARSFSTGCQFNSVAGKKEEDPDEFLKSLRQKQQQRLLQERDETEPHVIYTGLLTSQIKRLKLLSLGTSGMGIAMQPILIQKSGEVALAANIAIFGVVGFFTFGTPYLIHLIAKKYVTDIVYDPAKDTYKATTYSFFLRKKETVFTINDVKVPDVPGPFTSITISQGDGQYIPYFIAPESFTKPSHYGRFMGYDKPIDLHLNTVENSGESSSKTNSKSMINKVSSDSKK